MGTVSPFGAAVETLAAGQIQVVCFGVLFGVISGLYHRLLIARGRPRGPENKTAVRRLCIVVVLLFGLAGTGQWSASSGHAVLIGFAFGAGYGALRVLGTAIVFRRIRYLLAGQIEVSVSPQRKVVELWITRAFAIVLIGIVSFWTLHSQNIYQFAATGVPPLVVLVLFSGMFDKVSLVLCVLTPIALYLFYASEQRSAAEIRNAVAHQQTQCPVHTLPSGNTYQYIKPDGTCG
jgi:hypothetical protein